MERKLNKQKYFIIISNIIAFIAILVAIFEWKTIHRNESSQCGQNICRERQTLRWRHNVYLRHTQFCSWPRHTVASLPLCRETIIKASRLYFDAVPGQKSKKRAEYHIFSVSLQVR
jgi:hypothetical protein